MCRYLHHTQKIVTAVDEFDFAERIKPSAVMEYFQDLATVHASEIGIGFEEMKERNLCWVLNRLSAVIDKMPRLGEEITVTTYPHKPGLVEAVRDYRITNAAGESLLRGTSRWCVLYIPTKAIRRCAPLFSYPDDAYFFGETVTDGNPQLPSVTTFGNGKRAINGCVHITDLDRNGHMNNARYGDIMVNSCDYEYYASHTIRSFDCNFLAEMKMHDAYSVQTHTENGITYFEAVGGEKNIPVFRARIVWQ